jgi:hypothetical protein
MAAPYVDLTDGRRPEQRRPPSALGLAVLKRSRYHSTAPTPDRYPGIPMDRMPSATLTAAGVRRARIEVTYNGASK